MQWPRSSSAVYDVGQGSLNALVDKHEHPMLFDLGWPLPFNGWTLPPIPSFDPFVQLESGGQV